MKPPVVNEKEQPSSNEGTPPLKAAPATACNELSLNVKGRSARSAAKATAAVRASQSVVEPKLPKPVVYEGIGSKPAPREQSKALGHSTLQGPVLIKTPQVKHSVSKLLVHSKGSLEAGPAVEVMQSHMEHVGQEGQDSLVESEALNDASACPLYRAKLPSWQVSGVIYSDNSHIVAGLNAKSSQWVRPYKGQETEQAVGGMQSSENNCACSIGATQSPSKLKSLQATGKNTTSSSESKIWQRSSQGQTQVGSDARSSSKTTAYFAQEATLVKSGGGCCASSDGAKISVNLGAKDQKAGYKPTVLHDERTTLDKAHGSVGEVDLGQVPQSASVCGCEAEVSEGALKQEQVMYCPVEMSLSLLGGKYKSLILWKLLECGTLRFQQLRRLIPKATPKILTQQLRELEEHGLVRRTVYPVVPPKVEYSLTALGITIQPLLEAMYNWGAQYLKHLGHNANCTMAVTSPVLPKIEAKVQTTEAETKTEAKES